MVTRIEAPKFAVLWAPGINRDLATVAAFEAVGARAEILRIGTLIEKPKQLFDFSGFFIPGGFSRGDHIQAGVMLALEMRQMKVELEEFAFTKKRPIVGICNGFQGLVQLGLLPMGKIVPRNELVATLTNNTSGKFESRFDVHLKPQPSVNKYLHGTDILTLPADHGEGRFEAKDEVFKQIEDNGQVVYRYCDKRGVPTQVYPANPNNSKHAIAGITDPTGIIFGMMPHPEDSIIKEHHPNWRRGEAEGEPDGLRFFRQLADYAKQM
jgi:phosphoribosylformylglycinamidine synthase subunit PurQ / glutaminase